MRTKYERNKKNANVRTKSCVKFKSKRSGNVKKDWKNSLLKVKIKIR
jgi:hypothetical protein